ncbi:N-acetylmuramoyl-L-alanine amidase [Brevibacillus ruminantium]|uniref:N-acetylmuramoyl-L-alanine amidase n=2 Tax=Brevibacillus ruminantium TaxID=2950604 RepID=A0ABY4WQW0_9BACL|nr:N-acetylmuramoyl-L-alanine amidase [Brevibacillus ruminantium]
MRHSKFLFLLAAFLFLLPAQGSAVPLTSVQVLIDVGHGGVDSGTSHGSILEKDINLEVGKRLYRLLTEKGYRAVLNRDRDMALSDENQWLKNPSRHIRDLAQRRHLAKEMKPELMVSLHVNWSSDSRSRGPLVIYQANDQSYWLASILQNRLNQLAKTNSHPVKGRTYYLLKQELCPTVIVEMGFISNRADRALLTTPEQQDKLARVISEALEEYLLLTNDLQRKGSQASFGKRQLGWWERLRSTIRN